MRNNRFFQRLSIAFNFVIYGKSRCRIMTCGKCGAQTIVKVSDAVSEKYIDEGKQIDLLWSEFVQCEKCGAICQEVQMWNFSGDPYKIDSNINLKNNSNKG